MRDVATPTQEDAGKGTSALASNAAAKAELRRDMVARVRAIDPGERTRRAEAAADSLARLLTAHVAAGATIGLYAATSTELPSAPAVQMLARRYTLAFPRVAGDSIRFHRASFDQLTRHASSILEPQPTDPAVQPVALVIPARAYDRFGVRLGHGAGYYDRTLATLPESTLLFGLCFSFQVIDQLPREPYDRWVHWLVTDEGAPQRCQALPSRMHGPPGGPFSPEFPGASVPSERDAS